MDLKSLIAVGLSPQQAEAYALLIEKGDLKPPLLAKELGLTRTNAYKILDKLTELGLAEKVEAGKKLIYSPANPIALADLASQFRAQATAREEAAGTVMQTLLRKYYAHTETLKFESVAGRKAVAELYRKQIIIGEDLYFIRTNSDIPGLGFETMHDIRTAPARYGIKRHGILSAPETGTVNNKSHHRSNLDVTYAESGQYTAPVEWSATNSSLLIVIYASEPQAILIADPLVGTAFIQVWQMLSSLLQGLPTHKKLVKA